MDQLITPDQLSFFDFDDIPALDLGSIAVASRDFRITEAHAIGRGSLREKAAGNLAAIRALKAIEAAQRPATAEEQALLVRYTGWGALASLFDSWQRPEFRTMAADLRGLLTEEEYNSARATTPNAHYTSSEVINAIWHGLCRMGLTAGAQILEPAAGIGHFFGLMPEAIMAGARRTAVEIDSVSARIARALYPDSLVHHTPFEATTLPSAFFDATVGNVPFGNYAVYDPAYRRQPQLTRSIHDYFFSKCLAKTRPGGLLALITSRYTMDKQDSAVRRHLAESADLMGAVRLPTATFQGNAGTSVTADIVFLRKRDSTARPAGHAWEALRPIKTDEGPAYINEYFAAHPEMMLGQPTLEHGQYGREFAIVGPFDTSSLRRAIERLPFDVYQPRSANSPKVISIPEACEGVKDGAYVEHDGRLYVRQGDTFELANVNAATAARIRGLMTLRDAVREVLRTQIADLAESVILAARESLNDIYDAFVTAYGPVSNRENQRAYEGDPDQPLLLSLETYNPETKTATKAAIFTQRTIDRYRPVDHTNGAAEALLVCLNETGRVDWSRIEDLTDKSQAEALEELDTLVFQNPEGGNWETADAYLSGNVRAKLAAAEAATCIDATYPHIYPSIPQPGD